MVRLLANNQNIISYMKTIAILAIAAAALVSCQQQQQQQTPPPPVDPIPTPVPGK
ncbi:MAG: hypothetical protein IKZ13_00165 [Akkermansia sp.]|nr:hypothetical protein [Akkermansia sp.]